MRDSEPEQPGKGRPLNPVERFCPLCGEVTNRMRCEHDGVQTVPTRLPLGGIRELQPGTLVAEQFRIENVIGRGAMGVVYSATQLSVQRPVALKVLTRGLFRDDEAFRRFYQEARSVSKLAHPNIVGVHDFGVDEAIGIPYIAMELVSGIPMREVLDEEGPLPPSRAAALLYQVARAIAAAHREQVIHRDLKPDNLMVSRLPDGEEHVTVLDFGIAKSIRTRSGIGSVNLTSSGVIIGTPRYISPEQIKGSEITAASDLYALGCILYEVLTGSVPFDGESASIVMLKQVNATRPRLPEQLKDGSSPGELTPLFDALIDRDPARRPATASDVAKVLRRVAFGTGEMRSWESDPGVGESLEDAPTAHVDVSSLTGPSVDHAPRNQEPLRDDGDTRLDIETPPFQVVPPSAEDIIVTEPALDVSRLEDRPKPFEAQQESIPAASSRRWLWAALAAIVAIALVAGVLSF